MKTWAHRVIALELARLRSALGAITSHPDNTQGITDATMDRGRDPELTRRPTR